MHRSGTSLVTGLLRLWGIELGPEGRLMEARPDNPTGFWEHLDLFAINEELLSRLGGGWADPVGLTTAWVRSPGIAPLRRRARAVVRRDFGHGRAWAWKDPRTSLLLPFWNSVLPGMRFVICVRHPAEVAASLRHRNGLPVAKSARLWALYTAAALFHTRGCERILIFPDRLLGRGGNERTRLRRFAGVRADRAAAAQPAVSRFAEPARWHHRSGSGPALADDALLPETRLLHAALLRSGRPRSGRERELDPELDLFAKLLWSGLATEDALATAKREAAERREELEATEKRLGERESDLSRTGEAVARGRSRIEDLERELEAARQELETTRQELEALRRESESHRTRAAELETRLAAAQAQARESETRVAETNAQLGDLESRLSEAEARGTRLEQRLAEADATASALRAALEERSARIAQVEGEAAGLAEDRDRHRVALHALRSTLGWQALERYRRTRDRVLSASAGIERLHRALSARARRWLAPSPTATPAPAAPDPPAARPEPLAPEPGSVPVSSPVSPPVGWQADPGRPPVVVVIPHWNRLGYLQECLASLFEHTRYPHHRICVLDQASTDGSREYLESLGERVHVIGAPTNLGFVRGCNLAAGAFPDWDVVFLNNDTRVTAGWLESLVKTAYASPRIGLVGARLVFPDGRTQEAGSQMFRDGSARAFGRLEPPGDLRYEQRREVDYCSAAALFVKREVLERCGAFEECYAPAYYEDADLAFKARAAGYKTLYEPGSTVVHREYGSSDPIEARDRMEHNRRVFVERWRDTLASHPLNVWQAPSRGRQQVLYVGDIVPAPDRSSGGRRLYELLRILGRHCDVSYAFLPSHPFEAYLHALEQVGVHVFRPGFARAAGDDRLDLETVLASNRFAPVICALHDVARNVLPLVRRASPRSAVVVDTYDVHFLREEREARIADDARRVEEARRTRRAELSVYARADHVLTVTEADRASLLAEDPSLEVSVVPNLHAASDRPAPRAARRDLLFVGGFSHTPNGDAVLYFCREVLPLVRRRRPDLALHVVGNSPPAEVLALQGDGVAVHGHVADLRYFLDSCLISVAPLRFGSGMKGKIGEAMAHGLPVVTTPVGAEGMDLRSGEDALIADDAPGLARAIVSLSEEPDLWERISANALARVRERWTPEAVEPGLMRLIRRLGSPRQT